jgi:ABC-type transport system involved in multi-copper enzyme maturation permease subunit
MRTIWYSLAWKEWHEHKWKLAAVTAALVGVAALFLRDQRTDFIAAVRVILILCVVPFAIFVGLGTAASERSRGTFRFLQALPVPMWRVALNKVIFGIGTLVVATLLTVGFIYVWCNFPNVYYGTAVGEQHYVPFSFGLKSWINETILGVLAVAITFYAWTIACGVNRRDEVSAGAVALLIMAIWTAIALCFISWLNLNAVRTGVYRTAAIRVAAVALGTFPGGLVSVPEVIQAWDGWGQATELLGLGFVTAALVHLTLIGAFVARFGRLSNLEIRSAKAAKRTTNQIDWLGPPRSSPFTSVAWKQFREAGPIALAGLAGIIAIVMVAHISAWIEMGRIVYIGEVYNPVAIVIGFIIAIMIGLGICFYDVQPQISTFWRSRPINPDLWFWCKYFTGLAVLLASIYIPICLIAAFGDYSGIRKLNFPQAYLIPLAHAAFFASGVAMLCLVRHAIYAAILSIGFMYICALLAYAGWYISSLLGWANPNPDILWEPTLAQGASALATGFVISTVLAWLAMRYDWGRKSRY